MHTHNTENDNMQHIEQHTEQRTDTDRDTTQHNCTTSTEQYTQNAHTENSTQPQHRTTHLYAQLFTYIVLIFITYNNISKNSIIQIYT